VRNSIVRIGKQEGSVVLPIMGCAQTRYYRNKMEYSFSNKRWLSYTEIESEEKIDRGNALGFHAPGSFDKIVEITNCHLQDDFANTIRNTVREYAVGNSLTYWDPREHHGLLRNMIIRNTSIDEWMLIQIFGENDMEKIEPMMQFLQEKFPKIKSLNYVINLKRNDTIFDQEIINFAGTTTITEQLGKIKYKIGPKSFFQTNTMQAKKLYDTIVDFADFQGNEVVYDLYTGLGSIALYVSEFCKEVIGIEEVAPAIEDAKVNATLNASENTHFYAGDVKDVLTEEFIEKYPSVDIVITDPPRAGMHKNVVQTLLQIAAPKIVYVSCNPATQARDIELLSEKYRLLKVQPVDMFPHTHHVESIALLELVDFN